MDEKDILKIGADAAVKPIGALLEKLFGGAVEEIGGMWQDTLKARRHLRRMKLYEKLRRKLEDASIDPKEVPEKIWVPVLQAVSLEDDEGMQERWAALLANAANPEDTHVSESFPRILASLTPRQALILDRFFDTSAQRRKVIAEVPSIGIPLGPSKFLQLSDGPGFKWDHSQDPPALSRLLSEGLIDTQRFVNRERATELHKRLRHAQDEHVDLTQELQDLYIEVNQITVLGAEFVQACRPPEKMRQSE
jgi:hypothetical protein